MTKNKKSTATFKHVLLYGVISCIAHVIACFALTFLMKGVILKIWPVDKIRSSIPLTLLFILIVFSVTVAISCFIIGLFFRSTVYQYYQKSEDKRLWIKSCLSLVVPFEVLRFVLSLTALGKSNVLTYLGFVPSFLFENTFLIWSGRHEQIYNEGSRILSDYLLYGLCYIIYVAVFIGLLFFIYRYFWKREQEEREIT